MKTALITGVTGQDGAYLTEFLLNKGYKVHGIKRRSPGDGSRIENFPATPLFGRQKIASIPELDTTIADPNPAPEIRITSYNVCYTKLLRE